MTTKAETLLREALGEARMHLMCNRALEADKAIARALALAPSGGPRSTLPGRQRLASNVRAAVIRECAADRAAVIEAAASILERRAKIYSGHLSHAMFNGNTMADELRGNIEAIRAVAVSGNDRGGGK